MVIYGTPTLDASQIDPGTLQLSGAAVLQNKKGKYNARPADCDGDGFMDLLSGNPEFKMAGETGD